MKLLPFVFALVFLSSCAGLEMAKDPIGTDEMRKSPCACAEIEYEFNAFEWANV